MKSLLLEGKIKSSFKDLKNNVERLRKMRTLNIKDIDEELCLKHKILSLGNKIIFFNSHFHGRI